MLYCSRRPWLGVAPASGWSFGDSAQHSFFSCSDCAESFGLVRPPRSGQRSLVVCTWRIVRRFNLRPSNFILRRFAARFLGLRWRGSAGRWVAAQSSLPGSAPRSAIQPRLLRWNWLAVQAVLPLVRFPARPLGCHPGTAAVIPPIVHDRRAFGLSFFPRCQWRRTFCFQPHSTRWNVNSGSAATGYCCPSVTLFVAAAKLLRSLRKG